MIKGRATEFLELYGMLRTIKEDWQALREGIPGKRFRHHVDERRARRGSNWSARRIVNFATGISLVLVGLGIGWLPGPGGFLAIAGLALVAQEIPTIADSLDRVELMVRRMMVAIGRRFHKIKSKSD